MRVYAAQSCLKEALLPILKHAQRWVKTSKAIGSILVLNVNMQKEAKLHALPLFKMLLRQIIAQPVAF